jgi:hypothetical protein
MMRQAGSGPINSCPFLHCQQCEYLQSLYVLAPTAIEHCCIQSVSLGTGDSLIEGLNSSYSSQAF